MAITFESAFSDASSALAIVVMGVAGAGKTTVGLRLAEALHGQFIDDDDLHTEEARAKMKQGQPLTDEDRWPWLDRIGESLSDGVSRGVTTIVASSALRRVYRDRLRQRDGGGLRFVYLKADRDLMRARVTGRRGHYMPASLVDSQFATLEPPDGESDVIIMPADADLDAAIPKLALELNTALRPS
jgi:gluconokinase